MKLTIFLKLDQNLIQYLFFWIYYQPYMLVTYYQLKIHSVCVFLLKSVVVIDFIRRFMFFIGFYKHTLIQSFQILLKLSRLLVLEHNTNYLTHFMIYINCTCSSNLILFWFFQKKIFVTHQIFQLMKKN